MYPSRFEATPVPAPGCRVSRYELASVYRDARALLQAGTSDARAWVHAGTRDDVIDLTGEDDDIEPQLCNQINSLAIAAPFEPFQIRPREQSGQRHTCGTTSPSTQASSSPRRSQSSQTSATTSFRPNKRKESEFGDAGDRRSGSTKRRLRPRGQVNYNEDAAFGEAMNLDEPEPERDMPESIERSASDSNGEIDSDASDESDTEVWEVKRVVAEKTGPRIHEFLLDWVGSDEQNWIAARRCQCRDLIADFRAIPRVPADTHYLATLERNRLRRADNARRTGAARPQNIRPKGPGSYRNLKTGRFEKRRTTPQLPLFDVETSDSDTEDEPESEVGSHEPSSWTRQEARIRTPSNTPSLDHFSASINGSPASMTSDIHPPDLQQDNLEEVEETVVWIRKTPAADDDSPSEPSGEKGKRPIQTAKITWIRETPGFEDEHSSFAYSEGTIMFTSTKPKTSQTSKIPSLDGAESMAPMPLKLPHAHLGTFGLPSINSQSYPTVSKQTSRWTAVKTSAIATSSGSPRQASVIPTTKPRVSQIASCNSPLLRAMIDQRCNLPQQNLPAVAQVIITRPGSFSGVSSVSRTPSSSNSASIDHIGIPFRAISTSYMAPPPPRSSPRADQEPAGPQPDAHLQFAKPVTLTSPLPVAISSRGGQTVPFTAPREAYTLKRPKLKAKKPLVSPRRPANTMSFVSNSYKPSQPASFSWSPPASPVRNTSTKKFSEPAHGFARVPEPAVTPSVDYASKPMPAPDVAVNSVRTEPLIDISDLLELATTITATQRLTSTIPLPLAIPETSIPPEVPYRSCQSITVSVLGKVHQAAESKKFAPKMPGGAGEVKPCPQPKTSDVHHASQGAAKKVLSVHGGKINLGKDSDGTRWNSSTTATPDTLRKSRSPIRREPPSKGTKQRKVVRHRYTRAIEDEIASKTGPYFASKKAIGAILTAASANAYRPAPTVAVPRNIERSPSAATKWFIAARKKEKEEALARAPKGLRPELNRDFGPWYPQGLCEAAKRVEAENFNWECRRLGVNYSRDTPLPSIET